MFSRLITASIVAAGIVSAATGYAQDNTMSNIVAELQELREEIRLLRGQVEDQQMELDRLNQQQMDQYLDLDRRLSQGAVAEPSADTPSPGEAMMPEEGETPLPTETTEPEVTVPEVAENLPEVRPPLEDEREVTPLTPLESGGPRELEAPGEAEQAAYDEAFRALRELRYADAAEGFDAFLREYPDSTYAPNAQYWLGEAYYVNRDFETALNTFQSLLSNYPDSNKEGDALLKIGFSNYELQQWDEARAALEQVRAQHAGTTLARLAENRLQAMRLEGHF